MKIEVMGPGCARCTTLVENAKTAVGELGLDCEILKVTDMNQIASRGVLLTPALAINGKLKTVGKVTSVREIKELLSAASH